MMNMCNLQESISLFSVLLTGPIFACGKVSIPKTMESIIDNCPLAVNKHRLERNYAVQSSARHLTLRGRKHIYKNISRLIGGHVGSIRQYIQLAGHELRPGRWNERAFPLRKSRSNVSAMFFRSSGFGCTLYLDRTYGCDLEGFLRRVYLN